MTSGPAPLLLSCYHVFCSILFFSQFLSSAVFPPNSLRMNRERHLFRNAPEPSACFHLQAEGSPRFFVSLWRFLTDTLQPSPFGLCPTDNFLLSSPSTHTLTAPSSPETTRTHRETSSVCPPQHGHETDGTLLRCETSVRATRGDGSDQSAGSEDKTTETLVETRVEML